MRAVIATNDPVRLSFLVALLTDAGIPNVLLDSHISAVEGGIGAADHVDFLMEKTLVEYSSNRSRRARPPGISAGFGACRLAVVLMSGSWRVRDVVVSSRSAQPCVRQTKGLAC